MVKPLKSTSTATKKTVAGTPARDVAAGTSQAFHHGGQRLRLLLIEDHAPLAEATADWLREMGMEVRIAESGNEALNATAAFRPEIVLCDLRLPDTSGLDLARRLKAKRGLENIFFAIHTAFGDSDIPTFAQAAGPRGVQMCISKPITKEKLDRLLREFAAHSRLAYKRGQTG